MPAITSSHNPRLARVRTLMEKRRQRDEEQAFVVEGVRLVEEGISAGWQAELVLYTGEISERGQASLDRFASARVETLEIAPRLMESIAGTETPQGLLAVFHRRALPLPGKLDFVLITDNLRDPGNLGTLLRSAAAAGIQAVLVSHGTTDAFAPKVLRAGMGAHFHLPIFGLTWDDMRAMCREHGLRVFLAEVAQGQACWDLDLRQPLALMVGSEAEGASREANGLANEPIRIPMPGKSESLNAAIAASIILFEVVRQRRTAG